MSWPHPTTAVPGDTAALTAMVSHVHTDPFGHLADLLDAIHGGDAPVGHVCATAWVFDKELASVLLCRHRTLGWATPGGHLEVGESALAAAERELFEETGLRADAVSRDPLFVHFSDVPGDPPHRHWNIGFLFTADRMLPLVVERDPIEWHSVEALPEPGVADLPLGVATALSVLSRAR